MPGEDLLSRRAYLTSAGMTISLLAGCSGREQPASTTTQTTSTPSDKTTSPTSTTQELTETEESRSWDVDPIQQDKLVGAHYYMWYWGDEGYIEQRSRPWLQHSPYTPELGQYDSRDPDVVNQHIKWALEHGINWFIHTLGSPGTRVDQATQDTYLEAELADEITWSLQTGFDHGNYKKNSDGTVPLDNTHNREQMRRYFEHYEDTYFGTPGYLWIDGRPVVFDFSSSKLRGDLEAAFEEATATIDSEPFLVANPGLFWTPPTVPIEGVQSQREKIFAVYDAIHKYAVIPPGNADEQWREDYITHWQQKSRDWLFMSQYHDNGFIPTVMSSFNDTEIEWEGRDYHTPFDLAPEEFERMCTDALDLADPELDAVIISTWNEFPEGTPVEPAQNYGTSRLETIRDTIGTGETSSVAEGNLPLLELKFDRTVSPENGGSMELAFRAARLDLISANETVHSYDIGTAGEEPGLASGIYGPNGEGEDTGRWFGGPEARTALYLGETAQEAVLSGRPIESGITAEVFVDGNRTDKVTFDEGSSDYQVSLQ